MSIKMTAAEEEIMQIIWEQKEASVKEVHLIISKKKKVAVTTVSTIVRILEKKGFVDFEKSGRTYYYYPKIARSAYKKNMLTMLMEDYFGNSKQRFLSFFMKENEVEIEDIEALLKELKDE